MKDDGIALVSRRQVGGVGRFVVKLNVFEFCAKNGIMTLMQNPLFQWCFRDASLQSFLKMTCVPSILVRPFCTKTLCPTLHWTYTNRANRVSGVIHCQAELLKSAGALPPKGGKKKKGRSLEDGRNIYISRNESMVIVLYPEMSRWWLFICLFGKFFLVHFMHSWLNNSCFASMFFYRLRKNRECH